MLLGRLNNWLLIGLIIAAIACLILSATRAQAQDKEMKIDIFGATTPEGPALDVPISTYFVRFGGPENAARCARLADPAGDAALRAEYAAHWAKTEVLNYPRHRPERVYLECRGPAQKAE